MRVRVPYNRHLAVVERGASSLCCQHADDADGGHVAGCQLAPRLQADLPGVEDQHARPLRQAARRRRHGPAAGERSGRVRGRTGEIISTKTRSLLKLKRPG